MFKNHNNQRRSASKNFIVEYYAKKYNNIKIKVLNVLIEVSPVQGQYQNLLSLLRSPAYGLTSEIGNDGDDFIITGMFPISNLLLINDLTLLVAYARPVYPAITNKGATTTQGDISLRSDFVRGGYGVMGEGVKIGIISNSYNTKGNASTDVANGDLPDNVTVLKEFPGVSTDEGRAMMQIIHDIAPKAQLYFRTGFISPGDFAEGIIELQQAAADNYDIELVEGTLWVNPFGSGNKSG